jgi:hypothetical protein
MLMWVDSSSSSSSLSVLSTAGVVLHLSVIPSILM